MKKLLLLALVFGGYYYYTHRPVKISELKYGDVVLYSTSWCGYCKKTRDFFYLNRIPFVERNIERDNAAEQQIIKISGGKSVPVVTIKGEVFRGYNEPAIRKKLGIN